MEEISLKQVENTVGKGEIARYDNFSFSCSVFHPFRELSGIHIKLEIVLSKLFQFGRVYNLSFGKGLIDEIQPKRTISDSVSARIFIK